MHCRVPLRRAMGRSRSDAGGGGEGGGGEGGGDKGAGIGKSGEEGDSDSEDGADGRDAEGGDTSGKGSGTDIGRSMPVVADTEGRKAGEEVSSPDGVEVKKGTSSWKVTSAEVMYCRRSGKYTR